MTLSLWNILLGTAVQRRVWSQNCGNIAVQYNTTNYSFKNNESNQHLNQKNEYNEFCTVVFMPLKCNRLLGVLIILSTPCTSIHDSRKGVTLTLIDFDRRAKCLSSFALCSFTLFFSIMSLVAGAVCRSNHDSVFVIVCLFGCLTFRNYSFYSPTPCFMFLPLPVVYRSSIIARCIFGAVQL